MAAANVQVFRCLDPRTIQISRLPNRAPGSLTNSTYFELQESIRLVGRNIEPIKVRRITPKMGDDGVLREFEEVYGLTGTDGLLRYPVFEAIGNHDVNSESPIKGRARERHGGTNYAWSWDDLTFLCLDMYPDVTTRAWMTRQLEKLGKDRPVILFFHYSLEGPYSYFWEQLDKDDFARAIEGYNVAAIFHGHEHRVGHYMWRGHPVFRPGAPRHSSHAFLAVRMGESEMSVAAWDFDHRQWLQSWVVPVRRGRARP